MCGSNVLRSIGVIFVALRYLVVALPSKYMNATWPPAHYSWLVTSDGFKSDTAQAQFQIESTLGHFCRNRQLPHGVTRIPFQIEGGILQFSTTEDDSDNWTVNVVFENVLDSGTNQSGIARVGNSWIWNNSLVGDGLYCSSQLRAIGEVLLDTTDSTNTTRHMVPEMSLPGLNATLGIEMVQHDPNLKPRKNIVTVLRQCTFIQFTPNDKLEDAGPCGGVLLGPTPTPSPVSTSRGNGSDHGSIELWGTFVFVLGTGAFFAFAAFLLQRRRRKRANATGDAGTPAYDAAAARMRQQESFVPAPDYTTANGAISLPTYDEATRK